MRRVRMIGLLVFVASGCAPTDDGNDSDGGHQWHPEAGLNNNVNQNNNNGNWTPPLNSRIYVNTRDTLYYVDPGESNDLVVVGDFSGDCTTGSGFYDLAVDDEKTIIGIAAEALYEVDKDTAECEVALTFPAESPHFFSLSFVKGVDPADLDGDRLIAASVEEGEWVRIDYPGGTPPDLFESLGHYEPTGYAWRSSGDIVSVQTGPTSYRTFATIKCENYEPGDCESDWLAEINPRTGLATLIGKTGYQQIFGLGFWGDTVYGFTNDGAYILIDVDTGAGSLVDEVAGRSYWGAGNTTRPYIVR